MTEWKEEAVKLFKEGLSERKIAKKLEKAKSTVHDVLARFKLNPEAPVKDPSPRILLLDVENAPTVATVWGRWKQNVGQNQVLNEGYLLTYAAKWFGEDLMMSNRIRLMEDDYEITQELSYLLNRADIVVAHNLKKHDIPLILTRMLFHGLTPPSNFRTIDTLDIAKRVFKFPSNSLDNIAAYLGLEERKLDNSGMELWIRCMRNEDEAFDEMLTYNEQDIVVLEAVYNKLRAWDNKAPSVAPYYNDGEAHCPICGSTSLKRLEKNAYTQMSEFEGYQCSCCGKVSRGKVNLRTKESMKKTLMNIL